jgi:AcrR family transcriptional regulator
MDARAASSAATAERILDATIAAFWESPGAQMSLDDVAQRAGVTVQTVIRRFGNKERLLAAAGEREAARVAAERDPAVIGDVAGAIRQLLDHYETRGDQVMRLLAEEQRLPGLQSIVDRGRAVHRDWCKRVFATPLRAKTGADRRRRLAQLVAVCDVYTWKLLRRDAGLSRRQTEVALFELIQPLIEED